MSVTPEFERDWSGAFHFWKSVNFISASSLVIVRSRERGTNDRGFGSSTYPLGICRPSVPLKQKSKYNPFVRQRANIRRLRETGRSERYAPLRIGDVRLAAKVLEVGPTGAGRPATRKEHKL